MATETDILKDIRDAYRIDTEAWDEVRKAGDKDMLAVSGDIWEAVEPEAKKQREDAKRPAIAVDELTQYTNQLVNEARANKRAIKVTAVGFGANEDTASFRQALIRQIEYRSNAQQAYSTMFENAVQRGFGFLRIKAQYVSDRSFDQELLIEPIFDSNAVTIDANSVKPDGSDMTRCTIHEVRRIEDFRREYPGAKIKDFAGLEKEAPEWVQKDSILVAEHWRIETKKRKLLAIVPKGATDPVFAFEDDKNRPMGRVAREREVNVNQVRHYLTNGVEILEQTDWPGKWIPVVCCYGKVLYLRQGGQTKRQLQSLIRRALGQAMAEAYYLSQQAEIAGMVPKAPVMAYEGQFRGHEAEWQKSNHEPVAYLYFKGTTEDTGNQVLPPPQRIPYTEGEHLQSLELVKEGARRGIQASIGSMPLPTQAQRRNEKSGIALKQIEFTTQKGQFHFLDHYEASITRTGAILEDLIPPYYDTARKVTVRKEDDQIDLVSINDPSDPGSVRTDAGLHDVTLSTGPNYDSERDRVSEFADTLAQIPPVFAQIGDLVVKLKNLGPIGDEIAERLTPPQYRKSKDGTPDPAQLSQSLAEAQQQLQQAMQAAAAMKQALDTEQMKQAATVEKAKIDRETAIELQRMKDATSIRVAEINAAIKGYQIEAQHATAHETQAGVMVHESYEAEENRIHQARMAQMAHQQALEQGEQAGQQQLTLAEQQAQQAAQAGAEATE